MKSFSNLNGLGFGLGFLSSSEMENAREIIIRVPKSKAISVVKVLRSRGVIIPKGRVPKCDLEAATFKVVGFRGYHKIKANAEPTR